MNLAELQFVSLAFGIGIGMGVSLAQKHGVLGFIGGFLGAVVLVFLLLGCLRFVAFLIARKRHDRRNR